MVEDLQALLQLKWAVQALAQPAETQVALYPDFTCKACELLGDFDNWRGATVWREVPGMTPEQHHAPDAIRDHIESMGATECFDDDLLRKRMDWAELRVIAVDCLAAFDWEKEAPPTGRSPYVR